MGIDAVRSSPEEPDGLAGAAFAFGTSPQSEAVASMMTTPTLGVISDNPRLKSPNLKYTIMIRNYIEISPAGGDGRGKNAPSV
jgi:hypothetical protein